VSAEGKFGKGGFAGEDSQFVWLKGLGGGKSDRVQNMTKPPTKMEIKGSKSMKKLQKKIDCFFR